MFVENTANDTFFVHPSACVDENVQIGEGTKIWHFCHISQDASIGEHCSVGQNVFVAPGVKIGKLLQDSEQCLRIRRGGAGRLCVLRAVHGFYQCAAAALQVSAGGTSVLSQDAGMRRRQHRCKCNHRVRTPHRPACVYCSRKRGHKGCARSCHHDGRPGQHSADGPANVGKRWMKRSAAPSAAESIAKVRTALRR